MNAPTDLSIATATRIDALCDRFESAWRAGQPLQIEDLLAPLEAAEREAALTALLRVELELRQRAGEQPQASDYQSRFVHQAATAVAVFAELNRQPTTDTSVAAHETRTLSVGHDPATAEPPSEPQPREIGRFQVIGKLGEGAFGTVYRARDPQLDRDVAIKVPRAGTLTNPADIERFLREAKAAATMHHPNICPVYEVGTANGRPFIVMALVPGKSLADHLRERSMPFPARQSALIIRKLALALELAHNKGIVHRDLKPANILIDDERKDVVVMDFGLARREAADAAQLTQSGVLMGTPAYMSPEQARGDSAAIGPASDIYSLGVILYELLAGARPFTGSMAEVLGKILHVDPPPPSAVRPEVDPRLEAIAMKAMARRPADRFPSMRALADALSGWLKGVNVGDSLRELPASEPKAEPPAKPVEPPVQPQAAARPSRVRWWPLISIGVVLIGLLTAATVFFLQTPDGTVRIEINDPQMKVVLDQNNELRFLGDRQMTIKLKPGTHGLTITRGDFTFDTTKFELKKRGETKLKVEYFPGQITVTQDGTLIGSKPVPQAVVISPTEPPAADDFALLFDGIDDYVEASWKYDGSHPLTVEAWITPEKLPDGVEIISCTESSGFNLSLWKDNLWSFSAHVGSEYVFATAPFAPEQANRRVHLAGVYDREQLRLYVDGTEVSRVAAPGEYKPSPMSLIFGGNPNPDKVVFHYAGLIDEVRISRTGRYAGNFQPLDRHEPDADTINLYHFDEGQGDVLKDSSGNNHHGKIVGAKWVSSNGKPIGRPASPAPDRTIVEWARGLGVDGELLLDDGRVVRFDADTPLPAEHFHVTDLRFTFSASKPAAPAELSQLADLKKLESVILERHPEYGLSDDWLTEIGKLTQLRWLMIKQDVGKTKITSAGLAHLRNLKRLALLSFVGSDLDADGLAHLAALPELDHLELSRCDLTDQALRKLTAAPKLAVLELHNTSVSADDLAALRAAKPNLKILGVTVPAADDRAAAEWVLGMKGSVEVATEGGSPQVLNRAADLPAGRFKLVSFRIEYPNVPFDAAGFTKVNGLDSLTRFQLEHKDLTDEVFCKLANLPNLFDLDIHGTLTDVSLEHVATLPKVRRLNFHQTKVTGKNLDRLKGLDLELLILHDTAFGDEGLAHLPLFPNLNHLVLDNTLITDEGLKHLRQLSKLQFLGVTRMSLTGEGFRHLKDLPALERISLATSIDDRAVPHLAELKHLKYLELNGTRISAEGLTKLKAALPKCEMAPP